MSSSINYLPPDCLGNAFSFLSLRDVLKFSSTSKLSMQRTVPEVHKRRNKLMIAFHWDGNKICDEDMIIRKNSPDVKISNRSAKSKEDTNSWWFDSNSDTKRHPIAVKLPSIYERIQCLYKNVPSSHPMHHSIYELITTLKESKENEVCVCEETSDCLLGDFDSIHHTMQQILKVFKIHSEVLKFTIDGKIVTNASIVRTHHNGNALDLNLDHYLGDVYIGFILMGNISSGLVEGVSERKWMNMIVAKTKIDADDAMSMKITNYDAKTWYQSWVFIHSTLLRTVHLTCMERKQLGLSNDGNLVRRIQINSATNENNSNIKQWSSSPVPFRGLYKTKTMLHMHKNLYSDGILMASFRDFGPLGPSFRGRDSVRTQTLYMKKAIECFLSREWSDNNIIKDRSMSFNEENSNQQDHDTIMFLALMHIETKRIRPMSCAPHTICVQSSYS